MKIKNADDDQNWACRHATHVQMRPWCGSAAAARLTASDDMFMTSRIQHCSASAPVAMSGIVEKMGARNMLRDISRHDQPSEYCVSCRGRRTVRFIEGALCKTVQTCLGEPRIAW